MASFIPACFLGVEDSLGSIVVGKRACIAIVDEFFEVQATIVDGNLVFATSELAEFFSTLTT